MSSLKRKIGENIVNPIGHINNQYILLAVVKKADPKNNLCTIEYKDKDGYVVNLDNVPVRLYASGVIDWFPKEDELVLVEQRGTKVTIISNYTDGYNTTTRMHTRLINDIWPSQINDTIGGFIF